MDPLTAAIALLRRYKTLEEGAHALVEWDELDHDVATFLAAYGHLAPQE